MRLLINARNAAFLCVMGASMHLAQAHFIWAEVGAGSQPKLSVTFTEAPGEETDAKLLPRLQEAEAWCICGKKADLQPGKTALECSIPQSAAGVKMVYGLYGKEKPFLLSYFAKGAATPAAASQNVGLPAEILARTENEETVFTVIYQKKPVADAEILLSILNGEFEIEGKTDAKGEWRHKTPNAPYAARSMVAEKKSGHWKDGSYDEVRHYTTLTVGAWSEPDASTLLAEASASRQNFPTDLKSIRGKVEVKTDTGVYQGQFEFKPVKDGLQIQLQGDEAATKWLQGTLSSIFGHRRASSEGGTRREATYTGSRTLLGTQIQTEDAMKSRYRIRDGQIVQVERNPESGRFVITILESKATSSGKYLPVHFAVNSFDAKGTLTSVENYRDTFQQINQVWVPTGRTVVTVENGTFRTHEMRLFDVTVER